MGIASAFRDAFRDWATDGVPSSGVYKPLKSVIRALGQIIEDAVMSAASGVNTLTEVACATTVAGGNITLSGSQTIDGVVTGTSRVLVKNQTNAAQNGVYASAAGAWTRVADLNEAAEFVGAQVLVLNGTTNAATTWKTNVTSAVGFVVGTTAVNWLQTGKQDATAINAAVASEAALREAADKKNIFDFATTAGTGAAYTVPALTALSNTELGDGSTRNLAAVFHVTNTVNNPTISVGGAAARGLRANNGQLLRPGQIEPGVVYKFTAKGTTWQIDAIMYGLTVNGEQLSANANETLRQSEAARIESFRDHSRQTPPDYNSISLINSTGGLATYLGLQAADKIVVSTQSNRQIDLEFFNGSTTLVANAAARLKIPDGATVMGLAPATYYDVAAGSVVTIRRCTVAGADTFIFTAPVGSIAPAAVTTPMAFSRCIIFGGQSISMYFCLGFGPMALEAAFAAKSKSGFTVHPSTRALNCGKGSTSLLAANDDASKQYCWWDHETNQPCATLLAAVAKIKAHLLSKPASEPAPAMMVWNIGYADTFYMMNPAYPTNPTTPAVWRKAFRDMSNYIRTECGLPNLVMCIDLLGSFDRVGFSANRANMMRQAQLGACKLDNGSPDPKIRPGPEIYDMIGAYNDGHLSLKSQEGNQAPRIVDAWYEFAETGTAASIQPQGIDLVSYTYLPATNQISVVARAMTGSAVNRPEPFWPGGIGFWPNAAPSATATEVKPVRMAPTTVSGNEATFLFSFAADASNLVPVTNNGLGAAVEQGRLPQDRISGRGWRTYDPRPIA